MRHIFRVLLDAGQHLDSLPRVTSFRCCSCLRFQLLRHWHLAVRSICYWGRLAAPPSLCSYLLTSSVSAKCNFRVSSVLRNSRTSFFIIDSCSCTDLVNCSSIPASSLVNFVRLSSITFLSSAPFREPCAILRQICKVSVVGLINATHFFAHDFELVEHLRELHGCFVELGVSMPEVIASPLLRQVLFGDPLFPSNGQLCCTILASNPMLISSQQFSPAPSTPLSGVASQTCPCSLLGAPRLTRISESLPSSSCHPRYADSDFHPSSLGWSHDGSLLPLSVLFLPIAFLGIATHHLSGPEGEDNRGETLCSDRLGITQIQVSFHLWSFYSVQCEYSHRSVTHLFLAVQRGSKIGADRVEGRGGGRFAPQIGHFCDFLALLCVLSTGFALLPQKTKNKKNSTAQHP